MVITGHLPIDLANNVLVSDKHCTCRRHQHTRQGHQKAFATHFSQLCAPGQKVDQGHPSKLLRARPQAIIRAGASLANAPALTLLLSAISAKGLATRVGVPRRCSISRSSPVTEAVPPANRMKSTALY